jgi:hypothetical protein
MRKVHAILASVGVLLAVLVACGGGSGSSTSTGGTGGTGGGGGSAGLPTQSAGPAQTVNGLVTDLGTGARLGAVTVSGGGQTTTTAADGSFALTGIGAATLTFTKDGYALSYATVNATSAADVLVMRLKQQPGSTAYDTTTSATLSQKTEAGPYALILSPNSLDTTDTNITVSITPLDPTQEREALPGSLVSGGTSPALLLPVTFAEFTLLDSAGGRVNLKASASAIVELPIPPGLRASYPLGTKVHCYSYNPLTGKWEDFVEGTVQVSSVDGLSPVLAASIRHFSWYGAAPEGNKCRDVYLKVVSAVDGRPLGNARVEASPGTTAYTDADGNAHVIAEVTAGSTYTAYQTGFDLDGSLTGIPGAKYIEFGKVADDELVGLVSRPCTGVTTGAGSGLSHALSAGGSTSGLSNALAVGDSAGTPLTIKVGVVKNLLYDVTAALTAGAPPLGGSVTAFLQSGPPAPDGTLQSPMAASGAKLYLKQAGGALTPLTEVTAGSGVYQATGLNISPGVAYTLQIDADGNGSIDGLSTIFAVGAVSWTNPVDGATVSGNQLTASWTDAGSGVAGYAPVYIANLLGTASQDFASYVGTDRSFLVQSAVNPAQGLVAGSYSGSLIAFSGWQSTSGGLAPLSNNVSGANVTGHFTSLSTGNITFTVR